MQLPGGIAVASGGIERDFAFKSVTGGVELALAEAAHPDQLMAARVTRTLCAILEHLGGRTVDSASVDGLCVGDRQYLMQRLAGYLGMDRGWLSARCGACGVQFDFYLEQCHLPTKAAGPGFPYVQVDTSFGACRFRVPTGGDQQAVAELEMEDAVQALLRRCLIESKAGLPVAGEVRFDETDRRTIEAMLEEIAPEVTAQAAAACPECGTENVVALNPYAVLDVIDSSILEEIHTLAWHYHWGEAAILALPRQRRKQYLRLINQARRVSPAGAQASGSETWVS